MSELWELLDGNGESKNFIDDRSNPIFFEKGNYHLGADVWIVNSDKKIFIQKRSDTKKLSPSVWAMTGGSVIYGETPKETIVRESMEELSIDVQQDELEFMTKFKTGNVWVDTYILKKDYDISKMKFDIQEVVEDKWVTWQEIDDIVNSGNFIEHRWEFVKDFLKKETNI
jgi:8-oxo-dGTP pyrophosphatase MutT (NUDIX family)